MRRRLGHSHPPVLVTVEAFQADLALSEQLIELDARGQPQAKRVKRSTQQLQRRLRSLCEDRRDGRKSRERDSARPWSLDSILKLRRCWTVMCSSDA